jgi:mttA/Hcf106 family
MHTHLCCTQAAKSLGQTLRAFQPTIREVVEVSQEIKGTLEQVRQHCPWLSTVLVC